MKCWWCGVEPIEVFDIHVMDQAGVVRQVPHWPDGDHPHSEHHPTADRLAEDAYALLVREIG